MKYTLLLISFCYHCLFFTSNLNAQNSLKLEQDSIIANKLFEEAWKIKFVNPDSSITLSRNGMWLTKNSTPMQMLGYRNISVAFSIKGSLDSAELYCLKTLEKAQELNIPTAIASAYQNLGIVASQKGNNKKALDYYHKIVVIAEQNGDSMLVMRNLNNMGLSYYKLGDYKNSVTHLMRGLKIAETYRDTINIINCTKNLSNVYYDLNNFDLSLKYALYTYSISTKKNDLRGIGLASNTLGYIYQAKKDFDNALKYFNIGLEIAKKTKNIKREATDLHSIGIVFALKKDFENAEKFFRSSLPLKKEVGDNTSLARTYNSLAELYINKGDVIKAQTTIDTALLYAKTVEDKTLARDILDTQKSLAKKTGDLLAALAFSDSLMLAKDSIYKKDLVKHIAELETIYKTEQKQQQLEIQDIQIINQQLKIKQGNLLLIVTLSAFLIFFSIIGLSFFLFKKRKKEQLKIAIIKEKLALEKYHNLYRDIQLKIIQEKIAGQEEERTRIARELHDGVGGNLVALKLLLEQSLNNPNSEDISSIASKVANTLEEVRSISHNLMPPIFNHIAIDQVLGIHIEDLNKSNKINFNIQFLPRTGWEKIAPNLQVEIYRIIQELCSNIQKYSNATKVHIQLSIIDNAINILMDDDGNPFEYSQKGIGHRNINERLMQFNGVFDKSFKSNSGNTYHIQIPTNQITTNKK